MMQMHPRVRKFMRDPGSVDTCIRMFQQHQETNGVPPTIERLGTSCWRSMLGKTSLVIAVTGSGVAEAAGGAPEEVAEAADEEDSAEAFAAEAAAGEVAEAAAPEHTAAETGNKPKNKLKKKKFMVMLQRKKKPNKNEKHTQRRETK